MSDTLTVKEIRETLRLSAIKLARIVGKSNTTIYTHDLADSVKSAEIVRKLRYYRGMTQEDFAYRLRTSVEVVKRSEWDGLRSDWQRVLDALSELNDWSGSRMSEIFDVSKSTMSRWRKSGLPPMQHHIDVARAELVKIRSRFPGDDEYFSILSILEKVVPSEHTFRTD